MSEAKPLFPLNACMVWTGIRFTSTSIELSSRQLSDAYSSEMAPRYLENL
jgi:hypothetical protein